MQCPRLRTYPSCADLSFAKVPTMKHLLSLLSLGCALVALAPTDVQALGLLIPKNASTRPFDLEQHRVNVTITNTAALTKVEQVFRNNTNRPLEATFVFPLPAGATVSNFSLWINGKKTAGAVLEKGKARQIYDSIVRRTEDPGLIEYIDGKIFKASIFPIPAGGTQKLEIQFGQVLAKQGDMYRYVYPLKVGKAYAKAKTNKDFTLTARVLNSVPITAVYSPTHNVSTHKKNQNQVVVGMEQMHATLDRDFELFFGLAQKDIGLNIVTHDPDGEGPEHGYFMAALAPRVKVASHVEIGQTITFVMDTSGSMAGPKIEQARKTLAYCIGQLRPQDHFNVVRFSTDVESLYTQPVAATKQNKAKALGFAKELAAAGGTAIDSALDTALKQTIPAHQPHQVIFVTDGVPTVGDTDTPLILNHVKSHRTKKTRLFTFGVGHDVNVRLLDALAQVSRGRADYVKPDGQDMENAVAALYNRISSPVLTDIKLEFKGTRVFDIYPKQMPDLFKGDQIIVFGRYRGNFSNNIVLSGSAGKKAKVYKYGSKVEGKKGKAVKATGQFLAPMEFMPKLWAARKTGYLLEQIRLNGEQAELKNEVIRLAKKFGLVTPYTSYLAVDDSEFQRPTPRPRPPGTRPGPIRRRVAEKAENKPRSIRPTKRRKSKPSSDMATNDSSIGRGRAQASAEESAPSVLAGGFGRSSGASAVEASVATRNLKEKKTDSGAIRTRATYLAGRSFQFKSGAWVQKGITAKQMKSAKSATFASSSYMSLMRKNSSLRSLSKLSRDVVYVKVGSKVYKLMPAGSK